MTLAKAITKTLDIDVDDVRIDLTATIKSYDLTDTKFIFDIHSSDGLTIDLTGSTAMYIVEYVHDSQTYAIQGDITVVNSTKISYNLTSIFGKGNEPSLEEFERLLSINVNSPTIYSQSILKAELNSNPINSILTTLSAENPSTMLGGTWTQLGTETKFDNTIYYWKRTN